MIYDYPLIKKLDILVLWNYFIDVHATMWYLVQIYIYHARCPLNLNLSKLILRLIVRQPTSLS
jgi:hypothetical protein